MSTETSYCCRITAVQVASLSFVMEIHSNRPHDFRLTKTLSWCRCLELTFTLTLKKNNYLFYPSFTRNDTFGWTGSLCWRPVLVCCCRYPVIRWNMNLDPSLKVYQTQTQHTQQIFYSIREADKSRGWSMWMFAAAFISSCVLSLWDTQQTKHNATN